MKNTKSNVGSFAIHHGVEEELHGVTRSFKRGRVIFCQIIVLIIEKRESAQKRPLPSSSVSSAYSEFHSVVNSSSSR